MIDTKPTKAEVWNTIYSTLIGAGIPPLNVRLHPSDISVDIQLQDDEFDDVADALVAFGLPSGEVWSLDNNGPHLWSQGEEGEFYAWGRHCNYDTKSPLVPGWNVSIYCQVRTANFPLSEPAVEEMASFCTFGICVEEPTKDGRCGEHLAEPELVEVTAQPSEGVVPGATVTADMLPLIERARAANPDAEVLTAAALNAQRYCADCGHPEQVHGRLNCVGYPHDCTCYAFRLDGA